MMIKNYSKQARQSIRKYIIESIYNYLECFDEYITLTEHTEKDLLIFFLEDYYERCHNDVTIPRYYPTFQERFRVFVASGSCPMYEDIAEQFEYISEWLQYTPQEKENARNVYGADKIEEYFYKLLYREFCFLCSKNNLSIAEYFRGVAK